MFSLSQNYLTRGFWGDEAWTSLISQLPYLEMLKTTAADFHPPAYYSVVEFVYKFFPPTEIVTRLISVFFYLLTLFFVYRLASEIENKLFGLISTLVVALNPIFFTFAFEARNYTMFAFAATGSIYFLIKLSQNFSRKAVIPFVFFSTLGIYTHYYMFFTLAAEGLYFLLFNRKLLSKILYVFMIVGVLYLPWTPFLVGQVKSVNQAYWIGAIDKRTYYEALLRILSGEYENPFRIFLFTFSILLLIIGLSKHTFRKKLKNFYFLLWLWAIIPFILASLPGLKVDSINFPFRPIFFWRYLINAAIPLSIIILHTAQRFQKYFYRASILIIIALSLIIDFLTFSRYPYTFKQVYEEKIVGQIKETEQLVTILPSFAEVLYYRNRNNLKNQIIVRPVGLAQFLGKGLLDAYEKRGIVKIMEPQKEFYYELTPGPSLRLNR